MKTLRLGLVGCGALGKAHAAAVAKLPQAKFVAYADASEDAAQAAMKEFGGEYAAGDAAKVLADKSIDAVYICTWHDSHASLAIAAARAKKHILIEKPLALKMDECLEIARVVATEGVHLMPAFKMRYYPLIQKAHAFIPRPQVIVGQMMDNRWPDHISAQDPVKGGANVHSQGCHTTDILRYLSGGEPVRLWAGGGAITHPGHPIADQCVATIVFDGGQVASWIQGDAATSHFTSKFFFEIFGGGKSVQLYDRLKKATFFDGSKTWVEERNEEEGIQLENVEFVEALLGRASAGADAP